MHTLLVYILPEPLHNQYLRENCNTRDKKRNYKMHSFFFLCVQRHITTILKIKSKTNERESTNKTNKTKRSTQSETGLVHFNRFISL